MAKHYTIARPYAKAIFEQAASDGQLETWLLALQGLAIIAKDDRVIRMWHDPKVNGAAINDLFYQLSESCVGDVTKKLGDKLKNLVALLVMEKRLEILTDISELYHGLLIKHQGVVEVEVISAFSLNDAQKKQFYSALEKRFSSKVSIEFKEDEALIGGSLLRSGNWVLDGSIRDKISRLGESLTD